MNGRIYKITNDVNSNIYIGKTLDTIEHRFSEHIRASRKAQCEKRPLYRAMNKYGTKHFKVELVEECSEDILSDREIYWINYYNSYKSGYNATIGGDGKSWLDHDLIIKYIKQGLYANKIAAIMNCSRTEVVQIAEANNLDLVKSDHKTRAANRRPVNQFTKDGIFVANYSSAKEAARILGNIDYHKHIQQVCKGKRKTAYGFIWSFEELT